jgi:hypothetical protein
MVLPELIDKDLKNLSNAGCYGICSDFVEYIK